MLSLDEFVAAAQERTGLSDFGDTAFREGLDRLVAALHTEARLNAIGDFALTQVVTNLLAQRLQVEDWYVRHPEIDDEPIDAPLIGDHGVLLRDGSVVGSQR